MKKQKEIEDRKREVAEKRRLKQQVPQRSTHVDAHSTTHAVVRRSVPFTTPRSHPRLPHRPR